MGADGVEAVVVGEGGVGLGRRELPQRLLDLGRRPHISVPPSCRIGRTSTSPKAASGTRAATSTARSGLSQSSRKKPASSSLASAKGPSLVTVRPCWTQDALGQRRIGEGLRDDQLPRCGELLGDPDGNSLILVEGA
jgi:hypothetical protein